MNILVLARDVPATSSMPGSPRLFSLCRSLSQNHQLILVTLCESKERYRMFLSDPSAKAVFEQVVILPNPPAMSSWWGLQVHRLRQEAHFVTRYRHASYHTEVCRTIRDILAQQHTDILYLDGLSMAQYVMELDNETPALIDLHDCLSLLYARTMRVEKRWLRKLALYAETRSIARWEKSLSRVFSTIILNSEVDERAYKKLDPLANTMTIVNGVDSEYFYSSDNDCGDMSKLIFTGVMNYGPNEDAAVYFCEAILPRIQEKYPHVEFWIVGQDPTEKVCALAKRPGVHVTGSVPDVRPYIQSSAVFVCPLRYGAGVKNKLLAALAMRRTVIATSLSVEGLGLSDNEELLIADDPEQFAAKVITLLENPAYTAQLAQNGQAFVKARYSWDISTDQINKAIGRIVKSRTSI